MAKKAPVQAPAAAVDRTSQLELLQKRVQDLETQVGSLEKENKELKKDMRESESIIAKLERRLTLCKAFVLSMYFYPGHIANLTSVNKGRSGDDRSDDFKSFQVRFNEYTKQHKKKKGDIRSGAPVTGESEGKTSRWVVRGDHLMAEYPEVLEEYLESVKNNKALMDRARAFQAPNFPSMRKREV